MVHLPPTLHALSNKYRPKPLSSFPKLFAEPTAIPCGHIFMGPSDWAILVMLAPDRVLKKEFPTPGIQVSERKFFCFPCYSWSVYFPKEPVCCLTSITPRVRCLYIWRTQRYMSYCAAGNRRSQEHLSSSGVLAMKLELRFCIFQKSQWKPWNFLFLCSHICIFSSSQWFYWEKLVCVYMILSLKGEYRF